MTTRITTHANLRDIDTRSKEQAFASVIKSLAGRLRIAAELVTGRPIIAGENASIPRNPSGDLGVNMSGPPWGSAFRAPHFGAGGIKPDTANFLGQRVLASVSLDDPETIPLEIVMQPHASYAGAPLSRLRPILRAYTASGGPLTLVATCRHVSTGAERTAALTISSTTEATEEDSSLWWDVTPGPNRLALDLSTTSTTVIHVVSLSLDVVAKRRY
jgi:hypothetical protein